MADLDIDNICRLCCEKKGRLRSLFEQKPAKDSLSLQQIILDVTRLEVGPRDGMPQQICRPCTNTLVKMHETIEGYRKNDLKLRQLLGGILLMPLVEIKEEEVDVEMLERSCQQDMMVENIQIKPEVVEQFHEYEQVDESNVETEIKLPEEDGSGSEETDEEVQNDEEWEPPKEDVQKPSKRKKETKPRKPRQKKNPNDPSKPPGKRIRKHPHPDRPRFQDFKCYVCMSDSLGSIEGVLAHLNGNHKDMLPYTCTECVSETVVIKTMLALNNHKRQHQNPEKCPHCERRYTTKYLVAIHIETHHKGENDPNPSPCEVCGKVYPTKLALKNHMRLHTGGSTCELCGKVFKERHKLKRHVQTLHEKLRLFECHICKKKLSSTTAVQSHINTYHSGQLFTCSYCPKTFTAELSHRHHEKKHIENPNYEPSKDWKEYYTVLDGPEVRIGKLKKCNLCGLETRNMGTHLAKVHFPTEYSCEICGTTFKYKPTYLAHVAEHEHGKMFRCPICQREFTEKRNLIAHLRTKQHRDHPLAVEMLGTMKQDDENSQEEIQVDFEGGLGSSM